MTTALGPAPSGATTDLHDLAERFGTPLYVYDLDVIDRQVAALRSILPNRFELAYAVKANPSLGIVGHLGRLGLGADVASGGELATAIRAGTPPDRIVFTGPGKRDDELEAAVIAGIRAITVESAGELARVEALSRGFRVRTPILLRVATGGRRGRSAVPIADSDGGKFGIDPAELPQVADQAVGSRHLRLLGLHAFGASNVLDASELADHAASTMALARELTARLQAGRAPDFTLELVDVGGGLGLPYSTAAAELDLRELGLRLGEYEREWGQDPVTRHTRVLVEPGRFLVGQAGTYFTRILDRKVVAGRQVAIVDGGIHHLVRPALVGAQHRIVRLGNETRGALGPPATGGSAGASGITVAGPLCSGLDVLATDALLDRAERGDLLAVLDTGAYGYTESMPMFLSHATPAEVAISGGRSTLLRPRIEPEAWLAQQLDPGW